MSLYIRELLLDSAHRNISLETRVDLNQGIRALVHRGDVPSITMRLVVLYMSGYSISELLEIAGNAKELLGTFFAQLASEIDYTDEHVIRAGLQRYPRYEKIAPALRRRMYRLQRSFEEYTHAVD